MAILTVDGIEVGPYPLPTTALRSPLPNIESATIELKPEPLIPDEEAKKPENQGEPKYIKPYQIFELFISATPTDPSDVINNINIVGPKKCILEEPIVDIFSDFWERSGGEGYEVPISPLWDSFGSVLEPFIVITPGIAGAPAKISGYYSERNFYDREWIIEYADVKAKLSGDSITYTYGPIDEIFGPDGIKVGAPWNPQTWYPLSPDAAKQLDSYKLERFIELCSGISGYQPSDIKKLRFFYDIIINGDTIIPCHMTVENDNNFAEERLKYAINIEKQGFNLLDLL
jgi:hypothetical protein